MLLKYWYIRHDRKLYNDIIACGQNKKNIGTSYILLLVYYIKFDFNIRYTLNLLDHQLTKQQKKLKMFLNKYDSFRMF